MPSFVLAWAVEELAHLRALNRGGRLLMVEHPTRGWELPGGGVEHGEEPEAAIHRELLEETGRRGKVVAWHRHYYPDGWVAAMVLDPGMDAVEDPMVKGSAWWTEAPPMRAWDPMELSDLGDWIETLQGQSAHPSGP